MDRSLSGGLARNHAFGEAEDSGVHYRPRQRERHEFQADALFEPSKALQDQLLGVLIKDAGLEAVPVDEAGHAARVAYGEAENADLLSVYRDWLAPIKRIFSIAIKQRLDVSALRPQDIEALHARIEETVGEALHRPLEVTRLGAQTDDRWQQAGGLLGSPYYLLGAQVEALRAIMARHGDWLFRVDELVRGFKHLPTTERAWEKAARDPEWISILNRALGFAGVNAKGIPPDALKKRSLACRDGALVPDEDPVFADGVAERAVAAYAQGVEDRARFKEVSDREVAVVKEMGSLRLALKRYVQNLENGPDPFDLPDILGWREEVRSLAARLTHIEQRRGELEKMLHADRESADSRQAIGESHAALGDESVALQLRLNKVREAYKHIGRHLERLADQGIVFNADRPIGLRELLTRVEGRLRQVLVAPPSGAVSVPRAS